MADHGLNERQIEMIRSVLCAAADKIDSVGLFGSRATGKYRDNSDIDLVLYGPLAQDDIDRLWTLFDSSDLPIKVDVVGYDLIQHPPLKEHIDDCMKPLFARRELEAPSRQQ